MPRFPIALTLIAAGLAATAVQAHHSFAMFDFTKTITLTGTVKEFRWSNPHVVVSVLGAPTPAGAPELWTLETTSPGNLTRKGWSKRTFAAGDKVAVVFHPMRDGSRGGSFMRAHNIGNGKDILDPHD